MSKTILITLSLSLLCMHLKAQTNGPVFKFDGGDVHDYHIIKRGPILTDTFWFQNTGTAPINISNVNPSCGCTSVDWTKSPVLPNQKGFISFGLKTEEQHGVFDKEIYIRSNVVNNQQGGKRYILRIKGDARDKVKKQKRRK
jgi:hypothetical protein